MNSTNTSRWDPQILELIPHRPPMLLINHIIAITHDSAIAEVIIDQETPFIEGENGVPSWIGLEYMGQTAALIGGLQKQNGDDSLGFLMGSRQYKAETDFFKTNSILTIECQQIAVVGNSLATFFCTIKSCTIKNSESQQLLAEAKLSVVRKPANTAHDNSPSEAVIHPTPETRS